MVLLVWLWLKYIQMSVCDNGENFGVMGNFGDLVEVWWRAGGGVVVVL